MIKQVGLALTAPQRKFVFNEERFPLFCGGYGAGKSEALVNRALLKKFQYPYLDGGYFAPTYDLIMLIAWDRFLMKLDEWKVPHRPNKSDKVIKIKRAGKIIFRTLENPDKIVGFELGDAVIDELDTLKEDHAEKAWNKVIARCRQRKRDGRPNTCAVGTTPEGFRFAYKRWARDVKPGYDLVRAPSRSNPRLPLDYIDSLKNSYPPQVLEAYLEGLFVNMTSGAVYPDFDRKLNHAGIAPTPGEALHVGMDFNVYKMASVVFVVRDDRPYAVGEITNGRDTPTMCRLLKERYPGHSITVYPDASGQAHKSVNSTLSDLEIIKQAGFVLRVGTTNPAVRDRVLAVNAQIVNGTGQRRLMVNTDTCPRFTDALEQQVYDEHGDPDKTSGHDHVNDAGGYFISARWPIIRPVTPGTTNVNHMAR